MNPARCFGCQYLCCDIITRLSNDVQGLLQEMEHLMKLQASYYSLQKQFNNLMNEYESKLNTTIFFKALGKNSNCLTIEKIEDFKTFIRLIWHNMNSKMEKKWLNIQCLSILDGNPLVPTLLEIVNFVTDISTRFGSCFVHTECSALFNELSHQVNYVIYPELANADDFKISLLHISNMIPCLINLITVIDLFAYTSKYDSVGILCHEIVDGTSIKTKMPFKVRDSLQLTTKYLTSLLTGELMKEGKEPIEINQRSLLPVVEHSTIKMTEYVHKMTEYLLELSVYVTNDRSERGIQKSMKNPQLFQYRCIDHPYTYLQMLNPTNHFNQPALNVSVGSLSSVFTEMGLSPAQVQYMLQHQHHQYQSQSKKSKQTQKRSTSSSSETNDLQPIRVPRLSDSLIKPFCY